MSDGAGGVTPAGHRDRTKAMVLFGVAALANAAFSAQCGLSITVLLLTPRAADASPLPRGLFACVALMYLLAAAAFSSVGYGCCRRRRWARALAYALGGAWLAVGLGMVAVYSALTVAGERPEGRSTILQFVGIASILLCVFIIPGLLAVTFFQRSDVQATCEWHDPNPSWTDRHPLPVLSFTLALGVAALLALAAAPFVPLPLVSGLLTGPAASAVLVTLSGVLAVLTWQSFRFRPAGWWGAVVLLSLASAWALVSAVGGGLAAFADATGLGDRDPATALPRAVVVVWVGLATLGWALYVRRVRAVYPAFQGKAGA